MVLSLLDGFDDVLVVPFMPDSAIVTLNIGVLLRLSGLDVLDGDALFLCPYSERLADVFGAIVDPDHAWFSAPFNDPVEAASDPLCGQRKVYYFYPQPFAIEVIQHVQLPKSMAIAETICQEMHRPGHIGRFWHGQGIGFIPLQPLT